MDLKKLFSGKDKLLSAKDAAELLKTTPEALQAFEKAYHTYALDEVDDNFFNINSRQAKQMSSDVKVEETEIYEQIVDELLAQTIVYEFNGNLQSPVQIKKMKELSMDKGLTITPEMIKALPEESRPQLTGNLCKKDIREDSYPVVLWNLKKAMDETISKKKRALHYNLFRQGLDILDLDPVLYEVIGMNKNSMGYWLPPLVEAVKDKDFFKIPATRIAKVPLTLLQLTRTDYQDLTPATKHIVNKWAEKAFNLDENGDYFIKTGTYSAKFDFRNARVHEPKEVHELGEYLLFIHYQALGMASPLCQPCIYGVSTTNEWVVREFIPDRHNLPTIYKGLPLRTEYRVFFDADSDEILGIHPYWDEAVMRKRFENGILPEGSKHDAHDAITFEMAAGRLKETFLVNKDRIMDEVAKFLPDLHLSGQWSLDVMQEGDICYLIDMALAENSAFYEETVPKNKRIPSTENWIPKIS